MGTIAYIIIGAGCVWLSARAAVAMISSGKNPLLVAGGLVLANLAMAFLTASLVL